MSARFPLQALSAAVAIPLLVGHGHTGHVGSGGESREPLALRIITDRRHYDGDDTVMVKAIFSGDPTAGIQFSDAGAGALYFYALLTPEENPTATRCLSVWRLQFEEWPEGRRERASMSIRRVKSSLIKQIAIHLPKCKPENNQKYQLRVGYTCYGWKLQTIIHDSIGAKVLVEEMATEKVVGAYDGALLSEAVTIAVGR